MRLRVASLVMLLVACSPQVASTQPADPIRAELDWFVGLMNGGAVDVAEYEARFGDEFRSQVTFENFAAVVGGLSQAAGTWRVIEYQSLGEGIGRGTVAAAGESMLVTVTVRDDLVVGLLVQPAAYGNPPASFEKLVERIEQYGEVSVWAGEAVDGECESAFEHNAEDPGPIGSIFKLYVLEAVANAVSDGRLGWDTSLKIRDQLKSIPTGRMQHLPDGTELTVLEFATRMISESDNTATDHLIDLVGRSAVEEAMRRGAHSDPALNTPFLSTREWALLKFGSASNRRDDYLGSDVSAKAVILDELAGVPVGNLALSESPIAVDTLEWFATPADLCRIMVRLWNGGDKTVDAIMSANPGIIGENWKTVWFKGGSEPGLLALAWLLERDDGRVFVLSAGIVNVTRTFPESDPILQIAAARDLLLGVD